MSDSERNGSAQGEDADERRGTSGQTSAHYPDPQIDNPDEPHCPICGGAIAQTDVICPHCGESLVAG